MEDVSVFLPKYFTFLSLTSSGDEYGDNLEVVEGLECFEIGFKRRCFDMVKVFLDTSWYTFHVEIL